MNDIKRYVDRLYDEWVQYGKIIIAIDFDDTFAPWKLNTTEYLESIGVYSTLRTARATGAYLTCHTACNEDRYEEIQNYFKGKNLELDSINQNPIELPYGNQNKIYANLFLDDRAGLLEALQILNDAMYRYRGYLNTKNITVQNTDF